MKNETFDLIDKAMNGYKQALQSILVGVQEIRLKKIFSRSLDCGRLLSKQAFILRRLKKLCAPEV